MAWILHLILPKRFVEVTNLFVTQINQNVKFVVGVFVYYGCLNL